MSVDIVLDPGEAAAVVVQPPAVSPVQVASAGGGGVTDHGALTGLGDDDHTQYALADGSRGAFAASTHQHTMADLTDYTPPDPGGLKVYTSWAEVDAETESVTGVLITDDWTPAGYTQGSPSRDATFFITTQIQTVATGPLAGMLRRQDLRMWDALGASIWRVRQTPLFGDEPWEGWWDGEHGDLPNTLRASLARAEDAITDLGATGDFDNPQAPYLVGYYATNWRTLTGFAELPDTFVVAHVFHGGGSTMTQTVVVALADGTSRTITRVSTDGTSYGAWTLQPTIPDTNVTISDDYVLTIGA